MSVVKGFGDRRHQCRRLVKTGACFLDPGGKVASLDELGHDEAQTVVGASHVVDRNDMGMVETRNDAGFVQVSLDILRARDSLGAGDFDRNRAVKLVVVRRERPRRTRPSPGV